MRRKINVNTTDELRVSIKIASYKLTKSDCRDKNMHITFYGAAREVTGSMHMLTTESDRILLDCGLFQGRRKECAEKNKTIPFDPQIITNIVLSHAHIDHSGRLPLLVKKNFGGRIICTRPTNSACEYLLMDSAHIQESDAHYLNYKRVRSHLYDLNKSPKARRISNRKAKQIKKMLKKGPYRIDESVLDEFHNKYRLEKVTPLYSMGDAQKTLEQFDGRPFGEKIDIGSNMTCKFYVAGHILGSAITIIHAEENGRKLTIGFSGDVGRFGKPILRDPTLEFDEEDRSIDLMIMESTYGDREHGPVKNIKNQLKEVLIDTVSRGGSIVIPSFAFGRTQEIIYLIHEIYDSGDVPKIPVYIDSPLATNMTKVFGEHPEAYDEETHKTFLEAGKNPFDFKNINFVRNVEESMALMRDTKPHIVISASGMCETGRILHHLRYKVHDSRNTILFVGFMAQHTLGRRLEELSDAYKASGESGPPPQIKILNKLYPIKAKIEKLGGFSGHGDKHELMRLVNESNLRIKRIALVHGEESQSLAFAKTLSGKGFNVIVPRQGESIEVR